MMSELKNSADQSPNNSHSQDDIDLRELFLVLVRGKWLISALTGFAAVASIVFALSQPNIYTASALLAPAQNSGVGLSGLMRQYGGIASLAGVSIPGGEDSSQAQLGMHLMRSRAFIGEFAERRDILPTLMAVKSWDSESGDLVFDPEVFDPVSDTWIGDFEGGGPSALAAHKAFTNLLSISEARQTGYVTVSIDHPSPIVAAQWVTWLVEDVNAAVKAQDVEQARKSIEYLRLQVANTALADLQAVFFDLIQSQTETVMLAEVRPEYVFKTIDPAVVPEEKSKPSRAIICVLGTLYGFLLGIVIVLVRNYMSKEPRV